MANCREIITDEIAPYMPDDTRIVIRQSNPAKRHIGGYHEPNQEAYIVSNGEAILNGNGIKVPVHPIFKEVRHG